MVRSRLTDLTASATIKVMPGEIALPRSRHDENRLASVEQSGGALLSPTLTTFVYDGLGRLREQLQWTGSSGSSGNSEGCPPPPTGGGSPWTLIGGTLYIYDGMRVIQERDTNNTPTVSYTRGSDLSGSLEGAGGIGGLLARSSGYYAPSGTWSTHDYYHADGNGNITYLVNSAQTLAASYRYDPYGNLLTSSGSLAATNTYRFSSKEFIPSAGLYYFLYRFYDPDLQRWPNRDPLVEGGGLDLYTYVFNNPVNWADSFGLSPEDAQKILDAYYASLAQMTTNGERIDAGWFNNIWVWGNPGKRKGCARQSDTVIGALTLIVTIGPYPEPEGTDAPKWVANFDDQWTFTQMSRAFPPHQWVQAQSSNPDDPVITLDPFYNRTSMNFAFPSGPAVPLSGFSVNSIPATVVGSAPIGSAFHYTGPATNGAP
jgi:RHS repeat-associated protein